MPIVSCACGQKLNVKPEWIGRCVQCPACGARFPIAAPESTETNPTSGLRPGMQLAHGGRAHNTTKPNPPIQRSKKSILWLVAILGIVSLIAVSGLGLCLALIMASSNRQDLVDRAIADVGKLGPNVQSNPDAGIRVNINPPAENECLELAERFVAGVMDGELASIVGIIDYEELAARSLRNISCPPRHKREFMEGFLDEVNSGKLERHFLKLASAESDYAVLRVHRVGSEVRIWLRMTSETAGIVYQDLVFHRRADGQVKVADIYTLSNGELMSQSIRRMFLMSFPDGKGGLDLTPENRDLPKIFQALDVIQQNLISNPELSVATYHELPVEIQKNKLVNLAWIEAASNYSEREYAKAIKHLRQNHAGDPAVEVHSMSWFWINGEFDKALDSVEAIDKIVGGDDYLNVYRALISIDKGDIESAEKYSLQARNALPDYFEVYWCQLKIALLNQNHISTLYLLKAIDENFYMDWEETEMPEGYAEFADSPQYQEWLDFIRR